MRIAAIAGRCGLGSEPQSWLPGLRQALAAGTRHAEPPKPERPRRVERDLWRRMGPLEQLAVAAATDALGERRGPRIGVVWGSGIGSLPASRAFRRGLDRGGPGRASPMAFQVSVHNAPAGFIALAAGLTGPAESVFAGGATGLTALLAARTMLLRPEVEAVLVVAGDARSRDTRMACRLAGLPDPGDAVCALLLQRGSGLRFIEPPARATLARQRAFMDEAGAPPEAELAPDEVLGTVPALGLWCVGALAAAGGGSVVDWSGPMRLAVEVS